jgi:hypothetical protein
MRSMQVVRVLSRCALWALVGTSQAAPVTVLNSSFDYSPALPDGSWTTLPGGSGIATPDPIQGWQVSGLDTGTHSVTVGQVFDEPYAFGTVAFIGGTHSSAAFSQQLGVAQAGTYTVELDVGWRNDLAFAGYSITLSAGGVVFAEDIDLVPFLSDDQGAFKRISLSGLVPSGSTLVGEPLLLSIGATSSGRFRQTNFDNVSVDFAALPSAVPEPTTLAGVLMALVAASLAQRRSVRR